MLFLPGPWDARGAARPVTKLPEREVVALRDAHSTTTARADGSFVTRLSRQSVHWFDGEERVWRDIDTDLAASAKPGIGWRSGSNRFLVELADKSGGALASFEARQGRMDLWLEGSAADKSGEKDGRNAVTFRGVKSGVDLQYAVLADGVKETIVLRDSSAPSSYAFRLKPDPGVEWRAEEVGKGGLWRFYAAGDPEPAFTLLPPTVGDSAGAPVAAQADAVPELVNVVAGKASLDVEQEKDGSFVATVKLDEEWLRAPERVFPVVVDPTLYSEPDVADGWYETDADDAVQFDTMLRTGAWGAGQPTMMSVLSFDVASVPPGATVLDAKVNAWLDNCFPGSCDPGNAGSIRLRRLTGPWEGHTWSDVAALIDSTSLGAVDFPAGTTPTQTWQTWQSGALTDVVQGMVNGSVENGGFILDKSAGSTANGFAFRSSRWSDPQYAPYLDVTWVSDGVQVDPASSVHADGAELRWQHYPGGAGAYPEAVLSEPPLAYWRLGEGAGTASALDWSGNGHPATVSGGWTFGSPGNLADLDTSAWVDGSSGQASASGVTLAGQSFTVEAWLRRDSIGTNDYAVGQGVGSNNQGLHFGFRSSNVFTCAFWNNDLNTSQTYTDTDWHHWACTYDAATNSRTIYRDGVQVASDTASADYVGSGALTLGNAPPGSSRFDGWLDEVAIYPTALTQSRVQAHYAATSVAMPGFVRYEIHRSTMPGFTPSASTLIATLTDGASQSYRDTTAKPSTT